MADKVDTRNKGVTMNLKITKKSGHISNVKRRLRTLFPNIGFVEIKMTRTPDKNYKASISCHIKNRKTIISKKVCNTYLSSLDKAEHAIIKQIKKTKRKLNNKRSEINIANIAIAG